MKFLTTKLGLRAFMAGIFLFGLTVLTATSAGAQDINNWKQSDQAQAELGAEVKNLHSQLPGLSGIPLNNAKAKVYYYKQMIQIIQSGTPVGVSVSSALSIFDTPGGAQLDDSQWADVVVDNTLKEALRTDARTLLKL